MSDIYSRNITTQTRYRDTVAPDISVMFSQVSFSWSILPLLKPNGKLKRNKLYSKTSFLVSAPVCSNSYRNSYLTWGFVVIDILRKQVNHIFLHTGSLICVEINNNILLFEFF